MGALKDFLGAERSSTESMTAEELAVELNGFRALWAMMPQEVIDWVIRLNEPFHIVTRKYETKAGVLVNVRFEPVEFSIEVLEPGYDSVRGVRLLEAKVITMGKDAVLMYEDVLNTQDYSAWEDEQSLASVSLE